jgi:hypothetical protein
VCDPVSASIAVASAAASLGGSYMNAQAQTRAANSIAEQNRVTALAQNQGFTDRMRAAIAQTGSQRDVMDQTMVDRNAAFTQMREGQTAAMKQQQDIIAAENAKAEELRAQGDTAGQQMLTSTSGDALSGSQDASRAQAAALLSSATAPPIVGPSGTDPNAGGSSSGDGATKQAIARRLAEATTNIRTYGGKVGDVTSYAQPGQTVSDAIAANRFGIMPAQTAEALLKSGSGVRLLPSQIEYQGATNAGTATDALIQSRGQSGLDAAALSYGNATDIANLGQQDASTIAANRAKQQEADAAYQASLGNLVTGVGNLGLYGTGYLSGGPDWLKKLLPGGSGGTGNPADMAATNIKL